MSVFAGKVRTGELSASAFTVLRKRFLNDAGSGRPKLIRLLVKHFKEADRLIGQHGLARRIRTLDALQLAVALDLHRRGLIDNLISCDKQLLSVAIAEGIPVTGRGSAPCPTRCWLGWDFWNCAIVWRTCADVKCVSCCS